MAYYHSPKEYEAKTGKRFSDKGASIHRRSGLGFKYQCNLVNGTGIIDCDFINSDNEGHIFIKLVNRGDKEFSVTSNAAIAQGIFLEYGITDDDDAKATRNGGFGSTDKNE